MFDICLVFFILFKNWKPWICESKVATHMFNILLNLLILNIIIQ